MLFFAGGGNISAEIRQATESRCSATGQGRDRFPDEPFGAAAALSGPKAGIPAGNIRRARRPISAHAADHAESGPKFSRTFLNHGATVRRRLLADQAHPRMTVSLGLRFWNRLKMDMSDRKIATLSPPHVVIVGAGPTGVGLAGNPVHPPRHPDGKLTLRQTKLLPDRFGCASLVPRGDMRLRRLGVLGRQPAGNSTWQIAAPAQTGLPCTTTGKPAG